jgi:predicted XRE-type DNA-binding protein
MVLGALGLKMQCTYCTRSRKRRKRFPAQTWNWQKNVTAQRANSRKERNMTKKVTESSGNIFLDLGFPPHEAAVMLLRAKLAEALRAWMEREKLTQAKAAKRLGITQPRVSEITRGKVELLSLDYLVVLCAKAGIPVGVRMAA